MNVVKLFETQKKLDARIVEEKGLHGRDLLPEKIRALLTELGELSNEERSFKFWSSNREQNRFEWFGDCSECYGDGTDNENKPCAICHGTGDGHRNPLLEEYVDNLHFILSLGLEIHESIAHMGWVETLKGKLDALGEPNKPKITELFILAFEDAIQFSKTMDVLDYGELFLTFLALGRALGFTFEEIETSYYEKNEINHERQNTNY